MAALDHKIGFGAPGVLRSPGPGWLSIEELLPCGPCGEDTTVLTGLTTAARMGFLELRGTDGAHQTLASLTWVRVPGSVRTTHQDVTDAVRAGLAAAALTQHDGPETDDELRACVLDMMRSGRPQYPFSVNSAVRALRAMPQATGEALDRIANTYGLSRRRGS